MLNCYPLIKLRSNSTFEWGPWTSDTLENYKDITDFGPNLYKPGDIEYKFNAHGFRCDEFNLPSDLPIVFIGCSVTEGVGVHQHETWAYKLLTKIRNKTGKNIPYWNLGLAGHGVDTNANCLHWFVNNVTKPAFIFSHFPPFSRREFRFETDYIDTWASWHPNENVDRIFIDEDFKNHQARRSIMMLDALREISNAKMFCSMWRYHEAEHGIIKEFPGINYLDHICVDKIDIGRDNIHIGPATHTLMVDYMWKAAEQYF